MDVGSVQPQCFEKDLIDKISDRTIHVGVGVFGFEIENDFRGGVGRAAIGAELLDGIGAQTVMFFDDGVDAAGGGDDLFDAFAKE